MQQLTPAYARLHLPLPPHQLQDQRLIDLPALTQPSRRIIILPAHANACAQHRHARPFAASVSNVIYRPPACFFLNSATSCTPAASHASFTYASSSLRSRCASANALSRSLTRLRNAFTSVSSSA